ncbi:MAG: class I SAM-dependent methyltransferase [Patescibacteria group bacterium]
MKLETAKQILEKNKEDWEYIAQEFAMSRTSNWPEVEPLINYVKDGDKILDLGCGNGRLYELLKNKNVEYLGVDSCENLIEIAKRRTPTKFMVASALNLPFENQKFDIIFSIAVFHHIPSDLFREQVLKECYRVLKPGGYLILTTWNLWQTKLLFKYKLWPVFFGWRPKNLDWRDTLISWKEKRGTIHRYYHIFTFRELRKLVKNNGFQIIDQYYSKRESNFRTNWTKGHNLVIIAKKQ